MKIYVDELPIKVFQRVIHFDDGKLNCVELGFGEKCEPQEIELLAEHDKEQDHRIAALERTVKNLIYSFCASVYDESWNDIGAGCDEQSEFYTKYHTIADKLEKKDEHFAPYKYQELLDIQYDYFIDQAEKELKDVKD